MLSTLYREYSSFSAGAVHTACVSLSVPCLCGYYNAARSDTDMFISILDNRGRHDVIDSEPQKQRAHCSVSRNISIHHKTVAVWDLF